MVIPSPARADGGKAEDLLTLILAPDRDTTLYEDGRHSEPPRGELSNGAGQWLFTGLGPKLRRALVRFDLSALPTEAVIVSARLELTVDRTRCGPTPVALHRLLAPWGEAASSTDDLGGGGGGAQAQAGDATWLYRLYDEAKWQQPGGDYVREASASTAVGREGTYEWSGLEGDIQGWSAEPASNHGWIVIGEETEAPTTKRFLSREGDPAPRLEITYRRP